MERESDPTLMWYWIARLVRSCRWWTVALCAAGAALCGAACERSSAPTDAPPAPASSNTDPVAPAPQPAPTQPHNPATEPARTGGAPVGPPATVVTAPEGQEVLIGQHPVGDNLPAGMYTCARCHMVPSPEVLPRDRWPGMLDRMNQLILQYQLGEALSEQELARVVEYYVSRAPVALQTLPPETGPAGRQSPVVWHQGGHGFAEQAEPGAPFGPVIAGVNLADLDADGRLDTLFSDAKNNVLTWIHEDAQGMVETVIAPVAAPARTAVADLDADGDQDIAVTSLGSLAPTDDLVGSLQVLVRSGAAGGATGLGEFQTRTVLQDEPRLCDVRPADMDADGDLDLVFASFGLYHTGRAGWLEQQGPLKFVAHDILRSNGVSHVPVGDVNADGRPDVVAMLSQQHEKVMLYLNRGVVEGRVQFTEQELWRAPHPLWGNSSCEMVDLDSDSDLDVLFTNGDALDGEPYSKPWHGVQWLENQGPDESGAMRFEYHRIGSFHGSYWAGAGDFDVDGDVDVFVVSMMNQWRDQRRMAQVWFENDGAQGFTMWPVNIGPTYQVVGAVGDLDLDGRADVVTGGMYVFQPFFRVSRGQVYLSKPPAPGP